MIEYEIIDTGGQPQINVIDTFCPDPSTYNPGNPPSYPAQNRSYDLYPAVDTDNDGTPDACLALAQ